MFGKKVERVKQHGGRAAAVCVPPPSSLNLYKYNIVLVIVR